MKLLKFLNDNKYIIIVIILIIYLFFIYKRIEGFEVNERYDFKLSQLEDLMDKFIKKLLISEKDCRGRFTKYSKCNKKCGFSSVQTRKYEILKEAEKSGKKCPYKDGYTETIDCYMKKCEIGDRCQENLDCESGNCNNGECKDWAECSFNNLNMCDKTGCKQLNEYDTNIKDKPGYYLYDNRVDSCFYKTDAEIKDEEIKIYSYEYDSTAPLYEVKDCKWFQIKNENGVCQLDESRFKTMKDSTDKITCRNELMSPKPNAYNLDEACTKCIFDGSEWESTDKCNCSPGGPGYENQYINLNDKKKCLKINTDKINNSSYNNCKDTTFIGYSNRDYNKGAENIKWSEKNLYQPSASEVDYDPCVSISDPRYADTSSSPNSFYRSIVNTFDGANIYEGELKEKDNTGNKINYNGSATEFKDLKTAQKFCNNLIYKDLNNNEVSRCGFVLGYGYISEYGSTSMSASIVGNCNSNLSYNVNYIQSVPADKELNKGQVWSNGIGTGDIGPNGPRSRMPLKCSNEYIQTDSECPFYLDKGSDGLESDVKAKDGFLSGNKIFDSWYWNKGEILQNNVDCSNIPSLFCEYTTYWDETNRNRKPCKLIDGNCSNSPASPSCEYPVSEYCKTAIEHWSNTEPEGIPPLCERYSGDKYSSDPSDSETTVNTINNEWTKFQGWTGEVQAKYDSEIFTKACTPDEFRHYYKKKCPPEGPSENCKAAIDIYESSGEDICEDLFNNSPFNQNEGELFNNFLEMARKNCGNPGKGTSCCNLFPAPDTSCDIFFKIIRSDPNNDMCQEKVNKYLMDSINKVSGTNICNEKEVKNYRKLKSCGDWESQTS